MRNQFRAILGLASMAFLTGCFEFTEVITVNKDGSATIVDTALISSQLKAMTGSPSAPNLEDILPSQAKAEERAKAFGQGVTVKSREEIKSPDGREGVKVIYAVSDVGKLRFEPFETQSKAGPAAQAISFALEDGTLTMHLPQDEAKPKAQPPEAPKIPADQLQAQLTMLKPMFAGMRLTFAVKGAAGIAGTDASHSDGEGVTLADIQIDKILENPQAFAKLVSIQEDKALSATKAAELFKNVDGVTLETKKVVTVKLN